VGLGAKRTFTIMSPFNYLFSVLPENPANIVLSGVYDIFIGLAPLI
jgi:hypothetical protein